MNSEVETASESHSPVERLRLQLNDLEDYAKSFLVSRIERVTEMARDNSDDIDALEARVHELEQRVESIAGLADDQRSTPEKRAADLREAMIRAAQENDSYAGAKWWKDEVANALATLGHADLHKPDYYAAMEDAADHAGFAMTTKPVTKDGRTWDAKAVKVDLDDVPGRGGAGHE